MRIFYGGLTPAPTGRSASTPRPFCTAVLRPSPARVCPSWVPAGHPSPRRAPAGRPCPCWAPSRCCCRRRCCSSLSWCAGGGCSCTRAAPDARAGCPTRVGCMPSACTCPGSRPPCIPNGIGLLTAPLAGQQQQAAVQARTRHFTRARHPTRSSVVPPAGGRWAASLGCPGSPRRHHQKSLAWPAQLLSAVQIVSSRFIEQRSS